MLNRHRFEKEYRYLFENKGLGSTIVQPLAGGLLSGKYNQGVVPQDSRYEKDSLARKLELEQKYWKGKEMKGEFIEKMKRIEGITKEIGYTQAQIALAWGIAN